MVPLTLARFNEEIETKTFTNGKDDKPLVKKLYAGGFEEQFGKATLLFYSNLGWGADEAVQLAEVLASGAAKQLERLDLNDNNVGDAGAQALADAIAGGAVPQLKELSLRDNSVGDAGAQALAAAIAGGAAPQLKKLDLRANPASEAAKQAVKDAIESGS